MPIGIGICVRSRGVRIPIRRYIISRVRTWGQLGHVEWFAETQLGGTSGAGAGDGGAGVDTA